MMRKSKLKKIRSVMPKDAADPANQKGNIGRAARALKARFQRIQKEMVSLVRDQANYRSVSAANSHKEATWKPLVYYTNAQGELDVVESSVAINTTYYEYQIDTARYNAINDFINRLLYDEILQSITGDMPPRWFFQSYLESSFNRGISDALRDIQMQSQPELVTQEIAQQIQALSPDDYSPQAIQSLGLVYARVFNEMKGLTDSMKTDLAETLTRGMASGLGIRAISADIKKRVGVGFSRAQRIARTEILGAYRTAQRARTKEVNETIFDDSPYMFKQLWFSALASTSRRWHVSKHGEIYTQQEVEQFYSERGNSINCLCSQSPVLVNRKTGEAVIKETIERMKKQKAIWQGGARKAA